MTFIKEVLTRLVIKFQTDGSSLALAQYREYRLMAKHTVRIGLCLP